MWGGGGGGWGLVAGGGGGGARWKWTKEDLGSWGVEGWGWGWGGVGRGANTCFLAAGDVRKRFGSAITHCFYYRRV